MSQNHLSQDQAATVPVYWRNDPIIWTPCVLGKLCGICTAHTMRRKLRTLCPKLRPVAPAYSLPFKSAMALVNEGSAELLKVLGYECIRLTYERPAQLRDRSLKVDEVLLMAVAEQNGRAIAAANGWKGIRGASYSEWTREQVAASEQRIQSFV